MKLADALNKIGKIVGKSKYRSVQVELTSFGKKRGQKETIVSRWVIYCEGSGLFEGSTFSEAIKELKKSKKKEKRKFQDVKVQTK